MSAEPVTPGDQPAVHANKLVSAAIFRRLAQLVQQANRQAHLERNATRIAALVFGLVGVLTVALVAVWLIFGAPSKPNGSVTTAYADSATRKLQSATEVILGGKGNESQVKSVKLRIELNSDGQIIATTVGSGSSGATLDALGKQIVATAAPFAPFPNEMRQQMDILVIERTFTTK